MIKKDLNLSEFDKKKLKKDIIDRCNGIAKVNTKGLIKITAGKKTGKRTLDFDVTKCKKKYEVDLV